MEYFLHMATLCGGKPLAAAREDPPPAFGAGGPGPANFCATRDTLTTLRYGVPATAGWITSTVPEGMVHAGMGKHRSARARLAWWHFYQRHRERGRYFTPALIALSRAMNDQFDEAAAACSGCATRRRSCMTAATLRLSGLWGALAQNKPAAVLPLSQQRLADEQRLHAS